mmetsp:Transcript_69052/g.192216  ORF Transcript_69052/g.192216 Transcript_69052/m.192216 type:complete len:240 (-) Transcript_69052:1891-2610(-)
MRLGVVQQADDVESDDDGGEERTVRHDAHPHPREHDGFLFRPRLLLEDGPLPGLHPQGDGRGQIRHEDQEEDLQRRAHHRDAYSDAHGDLDHLRDVHGHDEGHEFLDPRIDRPALFDSGHDGTEVVVGEDHVRGTLGHFRALDAHGDTDVGRVQRWRVVHAITGHCANETLALQGLDNLQFVLRLGARKHPCTQRERVDLNFGQIVAAGPEALAIHSNHMFVVLRLQDAHVLCDGGGSL